MQVEFWNKRWENGQIGFHQPTVNPYLAYFYGEKGPPPESRAALKVFVPLCGKSLDLLWLAQNGYPVFGIECSEKAVEAFFAENGLGFQVAKAAPATGESDAADRTEAERAGQENNQRKHAFYRHTQQTADIEIYQGDFFDLQPQDLAGVTDVFDRASLIAFPASMRSQYVEKMASLQRPGTRTLLVTLSYDQAEMDGPPFSVSEKEVHTLYDDEFTVEKLLYKDILEQEQRFKAKGLTALTETVYKLTRR